MPKKHLITTERLIIEPFSEKRISKKYVSWLNDPEVVRYSENRYRKHTLRSCRAYVKSFEGSENLLWAIILRNSSEHIGNINAYYDRNNDLVDVGIMIGEKRFWSKGYGFEAFNAVCRYLIDSKNIRKVTAGTLSANKGMINIMERCGMVRDGIRKKHYLCEGIEVDMLYYALFHRNK